MDPRQDAVPYSSESIAALNSGSRNANFGKLCRSNQALLRFRDARDSGVEVGAIRHADSVAPLAI
jgi:hypothetical protein